MDSEECVGSDTGAANRQASPTLLRQHSPDTDDSSSDVPKRRKLSGPGESQSALAVHGSTNFRAAVKDSEWRLELCSGSDETLQLHRLSSNKEMHHSSSRAFLAQLDEMPVCENAFDSYRLETLATADRSIPAYSASADGDGLGDSDRWCDIIVSALQVAITIGCRIHVLSVDCKGQEAVICHDSPISATALNCDSSFVAFGDEAGILFIVHIKTRRPVFSQAIKAPPPLANIEAGRNLPGPGISALRFAVSDPADLYTREELVVVSGNGLLVRFSNLQLCLLSQAILDGDMALAAKIKDSIKVEFIGLNLGKRQIHAGGVGGLATVHSRGSSHIVLAGSGDACLSCWLRTEPAADSHNDSQPVQTPTRLTDVVSLECSGSGYVKILPSLDQRHLVALSKHGSLDVYERLTLTIVFRYTGALVDDFYLLAPGTTKEGLRVPGSIVVAAISKPALQHPEHESSRSTDEYSVSVDGSDDEDLCRKLLVISLPSTEIIYSMDVSLWSWLAHDVRQAQDVVDTILFVEGTRSGDTQSLFLRKLSETVPMERLSHFLCAGRYTEAERFAEENGIPLAAVYRRRLEDILSNPNHPSLTGIRSDNDAALFVGQFLDLLNHIEDVEFAVDACVRLQVPSFRAAQRLLEHARTLASNDRQNMAKVVDTFQRLGTWRSFGSCGVQLGSPEQFDAQTWHDFRVADLASYMRSCVARGDIEQAGSIWRRHSDDKRLCGDVTSAIQGFPVDSDTGVLSTWIEREVIPMLRTRQQWQDLAIWLEQRARVLEAKQARVLDALHLVGLVEPGCLSATPVHSDAQSHALGAMPGAGGASALPECLLMGQPLAVTPQRFIDGSLQFAAWSAGLDHPSGSSLFLPASDSDRSSGDNNSTQSCLFLRKQLLDLVYLRDKHHLVLTLDEYEQMSYSMISIELIDRVAATELLSEAYFDHFVPYAKRHQLDYARILQKYCIDTMDSVDREDTEAATGYQDAADNFPAATLETLGGVGRYSWEPRVISILSCLYSSTVGRHARDSLPPAALPLTAARLGLLKAYFEITLEIMRRSMIPWSEGIDEAIEKCFLLLGVYAGLDDELGRCRLEITEQFRLMCLKRMLHSHGLHDFHISNTRMAYPLLQWLVRKTDSATIMPDVLQLVDAYHHLSRTSAYVLRLQALCEAGEVTGVSNLVRFIDTTEHGSAASRFGFVSASTSSSNERSAALLALIRLEASGAVGFRAGQPIQRYAPMEVVRRGICWIREVLDGMSFDGGASRLRFKQLVGAAMAALRVLEELLQRFSKHQPPPGGLPRDPATECSLAEPELCKLQQFVAKESRALGVVWQLAVDGEIMVSPGELEQQHTREQILAEFIEKQWLSPYSSQASKLPAETATNRGKDKQVFAGLQPPNVGARSLGHLVSLPPIPANIKALATMLRFSLAQLWHQIVLCCLSLGLHSMAMDMCQHMIATLKPPSASQSALPLTSGGSGRACDQHGEWPVALASLAACERDISALLANQTPGHLAANEARPGLSGKHHGILVRRLVSLCQAASLKCAALPQLMGFLDAYLCWDLALAVFDQTTDGDFAVLTRAPTTPLISAGSSARAFASGTNTTASSSFAATDMPHNATSVIEDALASTDISGDHETSLSSWLGPLFLNSYVERGLVLDTDRSMHLVHRLVSALRCLSSACTRVAFKADEPGVDDTGASGSAHAPSKNKSSLGKSRPRNQGEEPNDDVELGSLSIEEVRNLAVRRCSSLVAHLAHNRHWMLAVQALELVILQLARSSFIMSSECAIENASEPLGPLRQRLASGGIDEDELALIFSGGGETGPKYLAGLVSRSLTRSLQQRGADAVFIFSAMLASDMAFAFNQLSTAMSHSGLLPSRVITLANIGMACSLLWKQHGLLDRCRSVAAAARWSGQLQLLRLKFKVDQLNNPKPELLEPLVRPMLIKTAMDITTVLEFADAFRLDETFVILEYISLCCSAPAVDGYQARILGIANDIANTKLLERTFVDSMENAISAYDYERLQFVVQRLQELRPQDGAIIKYLAVLDVLCSYDRKGTASQEELAQEWSRTRIARATIKHLCEDDDSNADDSGDSETVPSYQELVAEFPLAAKRLPFHYLVNSSPWLTLLPELTVDTVEALLPLAEPLDLSEDDFYINLIDSMLKKWKLSAGQAGPDVETLTAYEQAISKAPTHFNAVERLIRRCRDPEAAISTIRHVADELPCGPNRLAALNFGLKVLNKWGQLIKRMPKPEREQVEAKAGTIYVHFKKSLADANTEVALRRNHLETYLPLFVGAQDAEAVICALAAVFEGECERALLEANQGEVDSLHGILRNLAAIYEIGLDRLTKELLSRYLRAPVVFSGESAELLLPSIRYHATLRLRSSQEAVLRRRIVYLLRAQSMSDAATVLLDFAYKSPGVAFLCRVRALGILLSVASSEVISHLLPPEDVHRYLQALLYIADFEHVGIRQSTADFLSCDKAALARSIWVDYHEDAKVTLLVCNMCLDFRVDDSDLVVRMLPQLLAAGMFRYVVGVLEIIGKMDCYLSVSVLPLFWNQAVQGCLVQLARATQDGWIEDALAVLNMCARSIHLPSIDLTGIISALLQEARNNPTNDSPPVLLALAALDYLLPSSECDALVRGYIEDMQPSRIHALVLQLYQFSSLAAAAAGTRAPANWEISRGLTLVFDIVDLAKLHEQVLLHPPLGKVVHTFVRNRIHHDKLLVAVNACLERGKRQLAGQLVSRYYHTRAAKVLVADAQCAGIAPSNGSGDMMRRGSNGYESTEPGSPADTQDLTVAAQRFFDGLTEQQKLDAYIFAHK